MDSEITLPGRGNDLKLKRAPSLVNAEKGGTAGNWASGCAVCAHA
jgi:hypothetical protein